MPDSWIFFRLAHAQLAGIAKNMVESKLHRQSPAAELLPAQFLNLASPSETSDGNHSADLLLRFLRLAAHLCPQLTAPEASI